MNGKKKTISLLLTGLLGVSVIFFFNNCGGGFETMQDAADLSSNGNTNTPPPPGIPVTPSTGEQVFNQTVLPLFKTRCNSCHVSQPRMATGPVATDRIYNYTAAKTYFQGATSATNNTLYNKMLGLSHGGGNLCINDVKGSVTPCKETKAWILKENPLLSEGIAGNTDFVSIFGEVRGWALDPADTAAKIQVVVYVDGPFDNGGTLLNTYTADLAGTGVANGHSFRFQLPPNLANGAQRRLYIYGKAANANNLLPNSPTTYVAFTGTATGIATFDELVPKLVTARCMNCHDWSRRELTFPYLVSPTPLNGGTETNNVFIQNAAGMAHPINACGGNMNNEPCLTIRKWWRDEGLAP